MEGQGYLCPMGENGQQEDWVERGVMEYELDAC